MIEKSPVSKILVLRSMADQGEENEPKFIVPQNSVMNFRQKMGLSETTASNPKTTPSNNLRASEPATTHCQHCENMAKNFLYLESMLRTNYNANKQCSLCYSAIKYLEYVNKSIMDIFGNFDAIANAAKSFAEPQKKLKKIRKSGKLKMSKSKTKLGTTKGAIKRQEGGGIASLQCFPGSQFGSPTSTSKKLKTSSSLRKKTKKKKTTKTSTISGTAGGAFENGAKVRRTKKKLKPTNVVLLKQKSTKAKPKRKKVAKTTKD